MSFAIRRHFTEIHWVLFPKHVARTEPYFCQLSGPTPEVVTPAVQLVIIEDAQQSPPFLALRSSTTGALFPALWLEAAGFDPLLINCQPTDFLRTNLFFFFCKNPVTRTGEVIRVMMPQSVAAAAELLGLIPGGTEARSRSIGRTRPSGSNWRYHRQQWRNVSNCFITLNDLKRWCVCVCVLLWACSYSGM